MKNMIASQKKGNVEMGLNYHNLMEDIVLQHVDRILVRTAAAATSVNLM